MHSQAEPGNEGKYMSQNREVLDSFGEGLWERFTCHNPLRFYSLDKIADDFHAALKSETGGFVKESKGSKQPVIRDRDEEGAQMQKKEPLSSEELKSIANSRIDLDTIANKRKKLLKNTRLPTWEG